MEYIRETLESELESITGYIETWESEGKHFQKTITYNYQRLTVDGKVLVEITPDKIFFCIDPPDKNPQKIEGVPQLRGYW